MYFNFYNNSGRNFCWNSSLLIFSGKRFILLRNVYHCVVQKSCKAPFLMQSDLSVENGLFRLKPKSGFLTQSKRGFSTQLFSAENSDWRIQSKNSTFSTGSSSRKIRSKKFYTCFLNRSHRPSHHQTHTPTRPHGHTPIPGTSIIQGVDAGLAIPAVAIRSKSAWRIPLSARQQHVSHDGSSARSRSHAANNGCACCSVGGSLLSATPRT